MGIEDVVEYGIGPFEYEEAATLIPRYALALTNLGLQRRFTIAASPRAIENSARRPGDETYFDVILIDKRPDEPKPEGLVSLGIRQAEAKGYKQPRIKTYEALGKRMTLPQWAKAVGVSYPTLKSRINAGMTVEEAVTQIALKKAG